MINFIKLAAVVLASAVPKGKSRVSSSGNIVFKVSKTFIYFWFSRIGRRGQALKR